MKEVDGWSSERNFFDVKDYPKFPEEKHLGAKFFLPSIELDAVHCLTGSRPFFVNLEETDAVAVSSVEDEPFLTLSNSSDGIVQHAIPRRERPVSMQTMPLHYRRERGDCAWMLEESSPELKAYDLGDAEEEEIRLDDEEEDESDWRQFHVDWVRNIVG
jgi:hypothetical protein